MRKIRRSGAKIPLGNGRIGRSLPGLFIAAAGNIEKTLHHRADGVTAFAHAKIQNEPPVDLETIGRGDSGKLFHQPSLADTGLATDDNGASAAALPATVDHADKLRQFSLAADKWHACHRSIGDPLRFDLPDSHRAINTLDVDISQALAVNDMSYRTMQRVRNERLTSFGPR